MKTHGSRVWVEDSYSKRTARAEGEQKGKKKFLFIRGTKAETNNHGYGDTFCVLVCFLGQPWKFCASVTVSAIDVFHDIDGREMVA